MKKIVCLSIVSILILTYSCKKEVILTENEKTNHWIYSSMKHDYLFYSDIKGESNYNFNQDPETFFPTLLSNQEKGNRNYFFSYLEKKQTTTKLGEAKLAYGFDFQPYSFNSTTVPYAARVLYVLPNSPAARSGIKRGDWYYAINGTKLSQSNVEQLLSGGAITLTKGKLNSSGTLDYVSTISLETSAEIVEDPVFLDSVYTLNNAKIGYLVYNQFATGPNGFTDKTYDNELKKVFSDFKSKQITKLILDLRFNGGGYLTSCQLLCSMIVQASNLGKLMAKEKYNDIITTQRNLISGYDYINFLSSSEIGNQNVNMSDIYIICSGSTASASELVINALKPYLNVVLVGTTTVGKNMGSYEITDSRYDYTLHPITIQIFNSLNQSDYINGFTPTNFFNEYQYSNDFLPLGDTKEMVLNTTLTKMGFGNYLKSAVECPILNASLDMSNSSLNKKDNRLILK